MVQTGTQEISPQAIDTGTSLIYVPDFVADDFYAQVCMVPYPARMLTERSLLRYRVPVRSPSLDQV